MRLQKVKFKCDLHKYCFTTTCIYMLLIESEEMARQLGLLCVCIGADSVDSADSTFSLTVDLLLRYSHYGATKHRIGYIGCIGHIGVQIMLLLDMTQYKVVKGKTLGSVLVK